MQNYKLSDHFSLEEFLFSKTAVNKGINNIPENLYVINTEHPFLKNMKFVATSLEEIRKRVGKPIIISSGFRSQHLNDVVGGAKHSYHLEGKAVDFYSPSVGLKTLFNAAVDCNVLGKLIMEPHWIHLQTDFKCKELECFIAKEVGVRDNGKPAYDYAAIPADFYKD